jgi:hypothetical protein
VPPTTPFDNTTTPPRDLAPPERHTARPGAAPRTSRRHIAVVFNPATSPDDAPARKREVLAALQKAEVEVLWLETTEQDAAKASPARPSSRALTWSWPPVATGP